MCSTESPPVLVSEEEIIATARPLPPSIDEAITRLESAQVYGMDDTLSDYADSKRIKIATGILYKIYLGTIMVFILP